MESAVSIEEPDHVTDNVRVRFAPSPTGHLHIGGARTAIYNWAFARHYGGSFVLRIDDTDRERSTDENTQSILEAMRWLGLDWDEGPEADGDHGPYFQTQRSGLYSDALETLKANGGAYPCFCTPEQLEAQREKARARGGFSGYDRTCRALPAEDVAKRLEAGDPHVWRVKVDEAHSDIVIDDAIRGTVTWPIESIDDFILVRTDETPTYMFATVVDDWKMGITHIIRGDDHLSNTPRQIMVYEALNAPVPVFAHMGLIFGSDGKRLSKRHGATSVVAYAEEGYLPEALLNYLALLGWSLGDDVTLFDRERLVKEFDLSRVSKNPAVWDPEKLEWMNGVYLRELSPDAFIEAILPYLEDAGFTDAEDVRSRQDWFRALVPLVNERVKVLSDSVSVVRFLFVDTVEYDPKSKAKVLDKEGAGVSLAAVEAALRDLESYDTAHIEEALRALPEALDVKPRILFQAVRVAISGTMVSPPLFESLELLGRDVAISRIQAARLVAQD